MPFAIAAAGVTAGAGLIGASMQSSAVSKAGDQAQAALQQSRNDLMPWMNQGGTALDVTSNLAGANGPDAAQAAMANFYTSPGYQFRLDEGMRGVDAAAAARGMLRSGSTLKAEQTFAQGVASDEFSKYYSRLFELSNQGLGAAKAEAGVGEASARNAQATGAQQSSIYGGLASGLGKTANDLLGNPRFQGLFSSSNSGFGAPGSMPFGMGSSVPSVGPMGTFGSGGIF